MLSVRLICVGKLGEKFWADAVKEYTKRLGAYCKLEIIELPEQRLPQTPSEGEIAQALEKEAALIESKLLPGASVIAMCVEGKPMSSEPGGLFRKADRIGDKQDLRAHRRLVRPVRAGEKEGGAAAVHVTDDVSASFSKSDGARADLPRAQYRGRRQVPQVRSHAG